ncbi:MAG: Bifunctional uridylyltransferase/uridylyl-removing enzyme, partial [Akkermansiaceae bacterium]|nr:Bifunctional uridylyltransferase/uridylyl-removing enzyme [Akkermansiaceae bacterium]
MALQPAAQGELTPAERIALYQRFRKIEEHRIKLRLRAGGGGLEIARARADLIDVGLTSRVEHALSQREKTPVLTLVASGG